jgi:cytochrome c oxidase subunit 2
MIQKQITKSEMLAASRRFMTKLRCISLLAVLASPGLLIQAENLAPASPRRVEVTARRYAFDPGKVTLKKGEPVILVLKSLDVPHGLRIRELGVEMKASKGGTAEARFTPDKTGDFIAHCFVFCGAGHGTMTLTVHVVG